MPYAMIAFICAALVLRFATLAVSIRNERRMKASGAKEYGAANTLILALLHVLFYISAIVEWSLGPKGAFSSLQYAGLALYLFGALMLILVIRNLERFWTVKIIIAPDHQLVTRGLFKWVRHPNYFLNILPELIGFALALGASRTLVFGLPIYLVSLILRIRQEENTMREAFQNYGKSCS